MSDNITELVNRYLERHPGITRDEAETRVQRNREVKLRLQQRVAEPRGAVIGVAKPPVAPVIAVQRPALVSAAKPSEPEPTTGAQSASIPKGDGDASIGEPDPPEPKYKSRHTETRRGLKMFSPLPWFGHHAAYYIRHILMELGRLGLDIREISRRSGGDSPILDLLDWMSDRGNEAKLYDWRNFNLELLLDRVVSRPHSAVKPRIDVYAHITARGNLSVVWYPTGWQQTFWDREKRKANCDFLIFNDDAMMFDRPPNELMFIHGVGGLRPEYGIEHYGQYVEYNQWVLDALLICAVRTAYESLIARLKRNFEVNVRTVFVFQEDNGHVCDWTLEDPVVIQRRQDQKAFDRIPSEFGFTVELFDEELRLASQPKPGSDERPMNYKINEKLARSLKKAGYSVTPSVVERLRDLIKRVRAPEHDR